MGILFCGEGLLTVLQKGDFQWDTHTHSLSPFAWCPPTHYALYIACVWSNTAQVTLLDTLVSPIFKPESNGVLLLSQLAVTCLSYNMHILPISLALTVWVFMLLYFSCNRWGTVFSTKAHCSLLNMWHAVYPALPFIASDVTPCTHLQ